jgi:hypothetical protein
MEVSSQIHAPVALPPGKKPPVLIGKEAGWAPEPVWTLLSRGKYLAAAWNQTPAFQFVARHYTDDISWLQNVSLCERISTCGLLDYQVASNINIDATCNYRHQPIPGSLVRFCCSVLFIPRSQQSASYCLPGGGIIP